MEATFGRQVAQHPEKLLRRSSIDLLCDAHKAIMKSTESQDRSHPDIKDAEVCAWHWPDTWLR